MMIFRRSPLFLLPIFSLLAGCAGPGDFSEPSAPSGTVEGLISPTELSDGSLRAVWIREVGDGTDWHAATENVILMGYDSGDGRGVRILHEGYPNYNKPLLSPDGETVVFTDLSDRSGVVMSLDWAGGGLSVLGTGLALDVWKDPRGEVWVYVGEGPMDGRGNVKKVERFPLDRPSARELVWDQSVARDNFQLGASGDFAGGLFPAPLEGGIVDLESLGFDVYAGGCWASLSPGDRRLLWVFDGRHRNLQFYATRSEFQPRADTDRWVVNISGAPGIDGNRTYYPRWSNHSRFFAVSGPMPRDNYRITEIYVGRFSTDYQRVEAWSRLTDDDRPDFFPDVRVVPGAAHAAVASGPESAATASPMAVSTDLFETEGTLLEMTRTPRPSEIAPYRSAMAVYRYRVNSLPDGTGPGEIFGAHWVIEEEKVLREFRREVGETYPLELEVYDGNPKYEGQRVVSDLNEGGKILYVDVSTAQ